MRAVACWVLASVACDSKSWRASCSLDAKPSGPPIRVVVVRRCLIFSRSFHETVNFKIVVGLIHIFIYTKNSSIVFTLKVKFCFRVKSQIDKKMRVA